MWNYFHLKYEQKMTIMKTTRKRIEQKKMHGKSNLDEFPEKRFL